MNTENWSVDPGTHTNRVGKSKVSMWFPWQRVKLSGSDWLILSFSFKIPFEAIFLGFQNIIFVIFLMFDCWTLFLQVLEYSN